jgi:hypothetical protein
LPREPDPPAPKRGAHGKLPLARERLPDQQIGDIQAHDQQHEPNRRKENPQRRAEPRLGKKSEFPVEICNQGRQIAFQAITAVERRVQCCDFCLRLLDCDSRAEAGEDAKGNFVRRRREIRSQQHPRLCRRGIERESGRHYAKDNAGAVIEPDAASHNRAVPAERAAPKAVTDYH